MLHPVDGAPLLELEPAQPVLYLEVNIGNEKAESGKLLLFDGDSPDEVVNVFARARQHYQPTSNLDHCNRALTHATLGPAQQ